MATAANGSTIVLEEVEGPADMGPMPMGELSTEEQIEQFITTYIFPFIMLVGIVGNSLAIPTLYVISTRTWSTVIYLCLLALVDLLILLVRCGDLWFTAVMAYSLSQRFMNSSDAVCRTYMFAFNFVLHLSSWLIVAMAVEMTIAMRWPHRVYVMCTMERATNVLMLLVIILVCIDINFFWTVGVPSKEYGCLYTEEFSSDFRDVIWPLMTNSVQYWAPLVVVSVCFFLTVATVIMARRNGNGSSFSGGSSSAAGPSSSSGAGAGADSEPVDATERELKKYFLELRTLRDFRLVCLVVSLIFICLTFFTVMVYMVEFLWVKGHLDIQGMEENYNFQLKMGVVKTFDTTFMALFQSLKIFIYLRLSVTFRNTLKHGFMSFHRKVRRAFRKLTNRPMSYRPPLESRSGIVRGQGRCQGNRMETEWHEEVDRKSRLNGDESVRRDNNCDNDNENIDDDISRAYVYQPNKPLIDKNASNAVYTNSALVCTCPPPKAPTNGPSEGINRPHTDATFDSCVQNSQTNHAPMRPALTQSSAPAVIPNGSDTRFSQSSSKFKGRGVSEGIGTNV